MEGNLFRCWFFGEVGGMRTALGKARTRRIQPWSSEQSHTPAILSRMRRILTLCARHRPRDRAAIAKVFVEIRRKKINFVHFSDVSARSGNRELGAVKIPASYDAWRLPKGRKSDSEKVMFFWVSEISFSSFFLDFGGARQFQTSK